MSQGGNHSALFKILDYPGYLFPNSKP